MLEIERLYLALNKEGCYLGAPPAHKACDMVQRNEKLVPVWRIPAATGNVRGTVACGGGNFFHCAHPRNLDSRPELTLTVVFVVDVKKDTRMDGAQSIPFARLDRADSPTRQTSRPMADVVALEKWDDLTREAVKKDMLRNTSWWHAKAGDAPVLFRPLQHEASAELIEASHPECGRYSHKC